MLNRAGGSSEGWGVRRRSRSSQVTPEVDRTAIEAYLFQCGHEECGSELTAASRDALMPLVAQHLKDAHSVEKVTAALLGYLESTCVTALHPE